MDNSQSMSYQAGQTKGQAQEKGNQMMEKASNAAQSAKETLQDAGQQMQAKAQGAADAVKNAMSNLLRRATILPTLTRRQVSLRPLKNQGKDNEFEREAAKVLKGDFFDSQNAGDQKVVSAISQEVAKMFKGKAEQGELHEVNVVSTNFTCMAPDSHFVLNS
ncbi:unnamed protein product [Cuscuta campestris]|uniref:Uncharacterized protein n=1 Tax=Cuscuta campestris TaxID=132261 RepID=A0A484LX21_9ASTE|nr:unnamed protein product [Cuscuta campestris]